MFELIQLNSLLVYIYIYIYILECDHVFCSRCGDHFVSIPSTNLEHVIHPYKSCRHSMDDNINNNANIESTRTATPMPIQSGCRESSGTSNGSFNSPGGQKVKG